MMLPKGTVIAVADGEKLNLFRNVGENAALKLEPLLSPPIAIQGRVSGGHQSSSGNPDNGQAGEDGFSAGVVHYLNQQAMSGETAEFVIIAPPRALGEMRTHYHKTLSAILKGEISKDLTGHSMQEVEQAIRAA